LECKNAKLLLDAYSDGELDLQSSLQLQEHLRTCADCGRVLDSIRDSKRALKSAPYFRASDKLRESVAKRYGVPKRLNQRQWVWATMAASLLLAGFIGWSIGHASASPGNGFAEQLLSDHLKSLVDGHLADVLSSDKHTVKPWFDGKLDYSVPVSDFKSQGFPLLGGRLDFLNGKRVAALAFGRAKHIISVYVVPDTEVGGASSAPALSGYNVLHWARGGFDFWAISDLNVDELRQFENLMTE